MHHPMNNQVCVCHIITDSNKDSEEQRSIKFMQIIVYVVCNDHFIQ
jgi:hypothetical protein